MGQRVWFTADTHFGHANIIRHCDRPFGSAGEMDRALVENWNAHVGRSDLVYHLGDFSFRSARGVPELRAKLHGQIDLCLGNHDALRPGNRDGFLNVRDVADVKPNGQRVFLSHYAHRVWPRSHGGAWHLYGHSHGSLPDDPHALSLDVGVDAVARRLGGGVGALPAGELRGSRAVDGAEGPPPGRSPRAGLTRWGR